MKWVGLIFISLLFWGESQSQVVQKAFGSVNDDEFSEILEIGNGDFLVVGTSRSPLGIGGKDIYLARLNSNYDVVWSRLYGGIFDDIGYTATLKSNGNILIGGSSSSLSLGANLDVLFFEIDGLGNIIWSKVIKSVGYDKTLRRVNLTDNGFVACVMSNSVGTLTHSEMIAFEFSSMCDTIFWQNKIQSFAHEGDIPSSIISSKKGGFIMVGATNTSATKYDQVIMRLSETGSLLSHFAFGSLGNENCQDVIELDNEDLLLMANFRVLVGAGLETALIKINGSDNTFKWIKTYGDAGINDDRPYAFKINNDTIIMAAFTYSYGSSSQDLALLKVDEEGDLIDISVFGGNGEEQPFGLIVNSKSEVLIAGYSTSIGKGLRDAYLVIVGNDNQKNCFQQNALQNEISLTTHSFNYVELPANLSLDTIFLIGADILLDSTEEHETLYINAVLDSEISSFNNSKIKVRLNSINNTYDSIHVQTYLSFTTPTFSLPLSTSDRLYFDADMSELSPVDLMRLRNGFDAYQMQNIIANNTLAPLQTDRSPLVMVAADVDLSDKIRSNDVSMLQERIVNRIEGFQQKLPERFPQSSVDWRFVEQSRINQEAAFRPSEYYPLYSPRGYCRDNVPDIPFFMENQGSCDGSVQEIYQAVLLGDLTAESPGIHWERFDAQQSKVYLDIDDVNDLGNGTYRVFLHHSINAQDQLFSIDLAMDYNEDSIRFQGMDMTVEDPYVSPQWMFNDDEAQELLFTSYTMKGYPLDDHLLYMDWQTYDGKITPAHLGAVHVFYNGREVPVDIRLKSQTATGVEQAHLLDDFVSIYPNPTKDLLTISLPKRFSDHANMVLINSLGQTVREERNETGTDKWPINLEGLAAGLYQCIVTVEGKQPVIKKLIIQ